MRTVIAIQARLGSSRLPNKALVDLGGKPLIVQLVRRLKTVKGVGMVVVACPHKDEDAFREVLGYQTIPGPEDDVLTRILNVANFLGAERIVKVGADCPLAPADAIEWALKTFPEERLIQNTVPRMHPDGFDFDIWHTEYLKDLDKRLKGDDREWFASWAMKHDGPGRYIPSNVNLSKWRLTVDYPEDVDLIRKIYEDMGSEVWDSRRIIEWCSTHPRDMKLNAHRVTDFGARPL